MVDLFLRSLRDGKVGMWGEGLDFFFLCSRQSCLHSGLDANVSRNFAVVPSVGKATGMDVQR